MKRLFRHILVFAIPILILSVISILSARKFFDNDDFYKLKPQTKIILLGHSQTECGVNDKLIDGMQNFSQGGESYFYSYLKLQKLLDSNPTVKNVVISFSNNQIQEKMDKWVWGDENMYNYYPKYAFMMQRPDYEILMRNNFKTMLASEAKLAKTFVSTAISDKEDLLSDRNWGGYLHLKRMKVDSLLKTDYLRKEANQDFDALSEVNIQYLQKIQDLCKSSDVKLHFLRMPVHRKWVFKANEPVFQSVRKQKFPNVKFLDFQDFPVSNEELGDFDHLNHRGATRFSVTLDGLIKSGLLQSADPYARINDEINSVKSEIPAK